MVALASVLVMQLVTERLATTLGAVELRLIFVLVLFVLVLFVHPHLVMCLERFVIIIIKMVKSNKTLAVESKSA